MMKEYDWETRDDANTIKRYKELEGDQVRLDKAKSCIREEVSVGQRALGVTVAAGEKTFGRRSNPATIARLKDLKR